MAPGTEAGRGAHRKVSASVRRRSGGTEAVAQRRRAEEGLRWPANGAEGSRRGAGERRLARRRTGRGDGERGARGRARALL